MNLKDVGRRLSAYMRQKNLGVNHLGRLSGMSGAQITNIVNAKNYGFNKLLNILNVCPDLNVLWLLTGEGEMLVTSIKLSPAKGAEKSAPPEETLEGIIFYQKMTIDAYKSSVDVLTATNKDLRELIEHYKKEYSVSK